MLEIISLYIASFEEERRIRIYLPKNYTKEKQSYPVLYIHDGQNVFQDHDSIGGTSLNLEHYLDKNELNVIVVGIDQNSEERINEYCPWITGEYSKKITGHNSYEGGKGKLYVDFIMNQLKPYIDNKYSTLKEHTAMAGISLGGLISIYAMCRYPQVFRNITVFSSAFYRNQEELETLIRDSDLSFIERVYVDCGTKEVGDEEIINKEFLASNRAIYDLLKEKTSNVKFKTIIDAEHNYFSFRERVPELLAFLHK